jgi:hypothetical protein
VYCTTIVTAAASRNGLIPLTCNSSGAANVTGGGGGGGGGSSYSYTTNQAPQAASFTGIGGFDGTYFQPWSVSSSGVGLVGFAAPQPVTGAFYQSVQPVSIASTVPVSIASTVPVLVTNSPAPTYTPAPAFSPTVAAQAVVAEPPNGTQFQASVQDPSSGAGASVASGSSGAGTFNALRVAPFLGVGASTFMPGQATLTSTTGTLVVAARTGVNGTGRISVTVINNSTTAVYLGPSGVTSSSGMILPGVVGASVTLTTTAAIYGALAATGSALISYYELY